MFQGQTFSGTAGRGSVPGAFPWDKSLYGLHIYGRPRREDSVHLKKIVGSQRLEVSICPSNESLPVPDASFRMLPGLEVWFPFQVDVAGQEDALVYVVVEGFHTDAKFRVVGDDGIR